MKPSSLRTSVLVALAVSGAFGAQTARGADQTTAATQRPGFDCARAAGGAAGVVCGDPALAALDRQLAETYRLALGETPDRKRLRAEQRGWIKGRDDCWKADAPTACIHDAYVTRIVDLRIQHRLVAIPPAVEYRCDDNSKPFTATFYNDEPRAAVLTWGNDQAIVPAAPAASGARYASEGIEFWEHHGEATVDFYGHRLTCRAAH